jgi:hypothetical protein
VPITYLALFENWPGDLRKSYKWNIPELATTGAEYQQLLNRHALEAGPIEEGFTRDYQDRFSAVARQFALHIRENKWTKTRYQIFFNDKYYYKDPSRGSTGGSRGGRADAVSWWLLDEPNHHDDYRALSFFGWLGKRSLKDFPDVPMIFRADVSYVDYARDQLADQLDLDCTSDHFFQKNRTMMDNRNRARTIRGKPMSGCGRGAGGPGWPAPTASCHGTRFGAWKPGTAPNRSPSSTSARSSASTRPSTACG